MCHVCLIIVIFIPNIYLEALQKSTLSPGMLVNNIIWVEGLDEKKRMGNPTWINLY